MIGGEALAQALAELSTHSLKGTAYRIAQYYVSALSGIGALKTGGRYNPRDRLEALYLAEDPITALQEVETLKLTSAGLIAMKSSPKTLLSVEYELQAVLDLTTVETQAALGTTFEELTGPYLPLEAKYGLAPTQALGFAAAEAGIKALKVPSAKNRTAANLMIYTQPVAW